MAGRVVKFEKRFPGYPTLNSNSRLKNAIANEMLINTAQYT